MLYRDKYYNFSIKTQQKLESIELIISKQRNGPTGTIKLEFDSKQVKFFNINNKLNCPEPDSNW